MQPTSLESAMSIYTLILEYDGATYMTQVEATSESEALAEWTDELDVCAIDGFPLDEAEAVILNLKEQNPSPVSNLINVWNINFAVGHNLAILHLIKTELSGSG